MVEYTNEQAEYYINECEHENKEVEFAKYLNGVGRGFHPDKRLIEIISIEDAEEAHCSFHGPTKLVKKITIYNFIADF